jgi:hypothetical protein
MEQRPGGGGFGKTNNGNLNARANELGEAAQQQLDAMRERLGDMNDRIVGFIKERPGTAILIAVGAGYLIGRMLRS